MKLLKNFIIILLSGLISSCSTKQDSSESSQTVTINTPGVLCGICAKNIEKAVATHEGIEQITVDVENKKVEVKFVSGKTDLHSVESSISSAGYDANNTTRNAAAYEKLYSCCKIDG